VINSPEPARTQWQPIRLAIAALMTLTAGMFALVSLIHFGVVITLGPLALDDPFAGAAIPEGIIAIVLGIGALNLIARPARSWTVAVATTLFALAGTLDGLSVMLGSSRTADITYHLGALCLLAVVVTLLLQPMGRQSLRRR
jgi:hypothetical protein